MKTIRGVYHDLTESEYKFTVGEITFYFSSRFYLNKFMGSYLDEMERFNQSINNVYKNQFDIVAGWLALIRLYSQIEKRGFYIKIRGEEITCLESLTFEMTPVYKVKFDALIN